MKQQRSRRNLHYACTLAGAVLLIAAECGLSDHEPIAPLLMKFNPYLSRGQQPHAHDAHCTGRYCFSQAAVTVLPVRFQAAMLQSVQNREGLMQTCTSLQQ